MLAELAPEIGPQRPRCHLVRRPATRRNPRSHGDSIAITKDIYGHLIGDEKREATEAITDVLFDPSPGIVGRDGQTG